MRFLLGLASAASLLFSASVSMAYAQNSAQNSDQYVQLQTSKGPITMRIFFSQVPYTAGNFLDLVEGGFYNGLTFHRVENWVVQGGDPNGNGSGHFIDPNTGQPKFLRLETRANLTHNQAGMVAMARSAAPDSASCQFYILKSPMPQLNGKYAVFGVVTRGMQTVYAIRPGDRIVSATILQQNAPAPTPASAPASGSSSSDNFGEPTARPSKPQDSGF